MKRVVRGVIIGAVIGAVIGLLVGLVLHAIFGEDDSLLIYEIVAGLFGVIFGGGLGAFYGGAANMPRDRR